MFRILLTEFSFGPLYEKDGRVISAVSNSRVNIELVFFAKTLSAAP